MIDYTSPIEVKRKIDSNASAVLLDVRTPEEYKDWHIDESINIPLSALPQHVDEIDREKEIITICAHGPRSNQARDFLRGFDFKVSTMEGGMVAWNSIYDIVQVPIEDIDIRDKCQVYQFRRIGKGCLSYLVVSNQEAIIIDPTIDINTYINEADKKKVKIIGVLDTHTHADHISGGIKISQILNVPYYLPDEESNLAEHNSVDSDFQLNVGGIIIKAIITPGHTTKSVTYLLGNLAFTGDTLFIEGVGRPDLGQDAKENGAILWETLQYKLLTLPENTLILPAHYSLNTNPTKNGPVSITIKKIKNEVSQLKLNKDAFVAWIDKNTQPKPRNFVTIKKINQSIEHINDEMKIRDLEAGPNRCSVEAPR